MQAETIQALKELGRDSDAAHRPVVISLLEGRLGWAISDGAQGISSAAPAGSRWRLSGLERREPHIPSPQQLWVLLRDAQIRCEWGLCGTHLTTHLTLLIKFLSPRPYDMSTGRLVREKPAPKSSLSWVAGSQRFKAQFSSQPWASVGPHKGDIRRGDDNITSLSFIIIVLG